MLSAGNPSQRAHFSPDRKNPYGHAPKQISLLPAQFPQFTSVQGLHTADSIASPAGQIRAFVRATPVIKITIKPIIDKTAIQDFVLPYSLLLYSSVSFLAHFISFLAAARQSDTSQIMTTSSVKRAQRLMILTSMARL